MKDRVQVADLSQVQLRPDARPVDTYSGTAGKDIKFHQFTGDFDHLESLLRGYEAAQHDAYKVIEGFLARALCG